MNCYEIIQRYLRENGYDGLCNIDTDCGCELTDLALCDHFCTDCEPAYNHGSVDGYDFFMKPEKKE